MLDKIYIGDANGIARKANIEKAYMGDENGIAQLIYQSVQGIGSAVITLGDALTYNAAEQTMLVASVVLDGVTLTEGADYVVSGNTGTNAGSYTMTITGIGDYAGEVVKPWAIAKLILAKPTVSGGFTYDGSVRTATVRGMNATHITQSGTASATDAGNYSLTFALKSTTNTQWSDGTTAAVTRTWSIAKAAGGISVRPTTLDIVGLAGKLVSAVISYVGDGGITVSTSDTNVAKVSRSGNAVNVTSVGTGSAIITITLAEGKNYKGASCTLGVSVMVFAAVLAENTWEQIAQASAAGIASELWNVGDVKTEKLNKVNYKFEIIDFNHDSLHTTDAHYGNTNYNGGTNKAGITFGLKSVYDTYVAMNGGATNQNGWGATTLRTTELPKIKKYMPTALQDSIRTVSKLASEGLSSSTILTSADNLFLLSEIEVFGEASKSYAGEGTQYAYYKAGNSTVKRDDTSTSTMEQSWWLRSPAKNNQSFVIVGTNGGSQSLAANNNYTAKIAFAFCI